ncbi:MAG TPA: AlpA family phage regulatory protein [Burkholderiaceae bacterium]|nr:AlpA family phage regulatory protein [Burkholderiaceae bacterium]HQR70444.1 AlpA family phage regulatory protein [Burkholderiaceae bacterium]
MSIEIQRPRLVCKRIGFGKTSLYRMIAAGEFPPPSRVGKRAVGWPSDQVDAWIAERIRAGRKA